MYEIHGGIIRRIRQAAAIGLAVSVMATCAAQEQYPKPLLHTPANHPAQRVILLSIDGLHAHDLARWVADQPDSTLATLSRRGVTYTNARLPWNDPAVGMLALSTGGTPLSTGIVAADFYDRALSPAGSHCETSGTAVNLLAMPDEVLTQPEKATALLPRDPAEGCKPVTPHKMVNVGNIFEIVRAHGGRTAWVGDRPALIDLFRGPSGTGLSEAASFSVKDEQKDLRTISAADDRRVAVMLNWIRGEDGTGQKHPGVPMLLGMNFTAFAAAQRSPNAGYIDMLGNQSPMLRARLSHIDMSIERMVEALRREHLFDTTWIIVTATYAPSPAAQHASRRVPVANLFAAIGQTFPGEPAHVSSDGVLIVWLHHPKLADMAAKTFAARSETLGIGEIYTYDQLKLFLEPERLTSRSPDLILVPQCGTKWSSDNTDEAAVRFDFDDSDAHVALLVSGAQLTGRTDPTLVPTSQTAAMLLRALGMEKLDLPALHREHSPALPGIF